jgi:hypothetical protein
MHRVRLLIVTAFAEVGVGVLLLLVPAVPLAFILGIGESGAETLLIARLAGVALLSIGVASWLGRVSQPSAAEFGVLIGILIYDVGAALLLAYAGAGLRFVGPGLWPAVVFHAALAVWCLLSFRPRGPGEGS